ncbi:sensor histidine kinase [Pseudomonas petrae]|uniref:histidine kinase n=1 Tax=Pseudomonas petrae TaxID=2912190 RepID=A0ABS9I4J8_9PSED|nr:HAMP domain-containing sensor histidine kinase [Pseudomonas petrae]MCF7535835.1 HAMP domain-containing histidine kinase [Pseudomonas petrae]MCF7542697.1 HAMP domain-containing histidine kinase [Pseudomonas petrae]MCF7554898.1 HAMP domain-containing histidine kinase [Pseudomonas petrae]
MSEFHGKDEAGGADADREFELLAQNKKQVLAHLASLRRELFEAEASAGIGLHIELLVEANQKLVLAALAAQAQAPAASAHADGSQELREANQHLVISALHAQTLQAQAELALSQQRTAMASVAHEMRNPLTPISLIAERMVRASSDKLPEMRAMIEGQVQHLSRMVEDLLDVARASSGKLRLTCAEVDILEIIQEAVEACAPMMHKKNLHMDVSLPDTPMSVNGDRIRIVQIFTNVLTNSAKYTPCGGKIALCAEAVAEGLKVVISDNGIGISAQALPVIFDAYVQDTQAIGFNGSGLGIGLTVVRQLVEAHGGSVTAHSEGTGKGCHFTILFPLVGSAS